MWKLLHNGIPTDQTVRKKDIVITSKYLCYQASCTEHNNHLFLTSDIATKTWDFFFSLLTVIGEFHTLNHLLTHWWRLPSRDNLYCWLLRSVPCAILWNIRKSRNKALYDEKPMASSDIITIMENDIRSYYLINRLSLYKGKTFSECVLFFGLPVKEKACKLLFVRWTPTPLQWCKLNIDDACKGNPRDLGAGGIIRNHSSRMLISFAHFLRTCTSVYVDAYALLLGLSCAKDLQLQSLWIESDSLFLVNCLNQNLTIPWHLVYIFREIYSPLKFFQGYKVMHVYSEANIFADNVANFGISSRRKLSFTDPSKLPHAMRGALIDVTIR